MAPVESATEKADEAPAPKEQAPSEPPVEEKAPEPVEDEATKEKKRI